MDSNPRPITALLLLTRVDCDNGVASYCETIMQGLKEGGDRVVLVTGPVSVTPATQQRLDAMRHAADHWTIFPKVGKLISLFSSFKLIAGVIRQQNVDVIFPQGFTMLPLSKLLSFYTGKPVIANFHGGSASQIGKKGSLKEKAFYATVAQFFTARNFISMSQETSEFMITTCGIEQSRVVMVPYGVDVKYFRSPEAEEQRDARRALQIKDDAVVCVLPGWVSVDKGHNLVVDAVRSLRWSHPDLPILCLFAGSTDRGAEIIERSLKDEQDCAQFRFLGFVAREQLRQVYWAGDIVLLPSFIEGFAIAVAEAMACGCIAVRTPAGGCADQIVDGITGFVVPFEDPNTIADKIVLLSDPERRLPMREASRAHVLDNFDREKMVSRTIEVLRTSCQSL